MRRNPAAAFGTLARPAFTLVELLVVIAIIGTLMGLLIPAVQSARESARRNACNNNMRQIGVAVLQHDETYGNLPPGLPNCTAPGNMPNFGAQGGPNPPTNAWCQGPVWTVAIMPFMEEQNQFDIFKACLETAENFCDKCTRGVDPPAALVCPSAQPVDNDKYLSAFTSPSDAILGFTPVATLPGIAKATYAGNFGSKDYFSYKVFSGMNSTAGAFDIADVRGARGAPIMQAVPPNMTMQGTWKMGSRLGVKLSQVMDGQSNTMLASEILPYNSRLDVRGAWTYGGIGGVSFTTWLPPNSEQARAANMPNVGDPGVPFPNDKLPSCEPDPSLPGRNFNFCDLDTSPDNGGGYAGARSAHHGGVQLLMLDGSVHFIANAIEIRLWRNLATRNSGVSAQLPSDF